MTNKAVEDSIKDMLKKHSAVSRLMLQYVVLWGDEKCTDDHYWNVGEGKFTTWDKSSWPDMRRKDCRMCWQALKVLAFSKEDRKGT